MQTDLLEAVIAHSNKSKDTSQFKPVTPQLIEQTEKELGFALPPFLKTCLTQFCNGGLGPGYGVIGIGASGAQSDFGDLVSTYRVYEKDSELKWNKGMLPFCDFGCAMFACVDCLDPEYTVYTCEEAECFPQRRRLEDFFRQWMDGVPGLTSDHVEQISQEIINPFTGQKTTVFGRKKK